MLTVLITGGQGQVAWDLLRLVDPGQFTVHAPNKQQLDITQPAAIDAAFQQWQPHIVINTAAYTHVDKAEDEIALATAINRDGARNLAIACDQQQIPLLHLSTDYIFDGLATRPYRETDVAAPLGVYGNSKWAGEEAVRAHCERHLILRVSGVFGCHGTNFVKTMLRLAQERDVLQVVADQITCPTPAADIAATLWQLCEAIQTTAAWGTYHYCGVEAVSWHGFATRIIEQARSHETLRVREVVAIAGSEYPTRARRPPYSVLDCGKLAAVFGMQQPCWKHGLEKLLITPRKC